MSDLVKTAQIQRTSPLQSSRPQKSVDTKVAAQVMSLQFDIGGNAAPSGHGGNLLPPYPSPIMPTNTQAHNNPEDSQAKSIIGFANYTQHTDYPAGVPSSTSHNYILYPHPEPHTTNYFQPTYGYPYGSNPYGVTRLVEQMPTRQLNAARSMWSIIEVLIGIRFRGNYIGAYTKQEVIDACRSGKAWLSRDAPFDAPEMAEIESKGCDVMHTYDQYLFTNQLLAMAPAHSMELNPGWTLHVATSANDIQEAAPPPFGRRRWCPPLGLVRVASSLGVCVETFDIMGPVSQLFSHATPASVDIRMLGALEVTAVELITFFPIHCYHWAHYVCRLRENGWTPVDISRLGNKVRGIPDEEGLTMETVLTHFQLCPSADLSTLPAFSCGHWTAPQVFHTHDYQVKDLAAGVKRSEFPQGENRGALTEVILLALGDKDYAHLMLSEVEKVVLGRQMGHHLVSSRMAESGVHPDWKATQGLQDVLEKWMTEGTPGYLQ